MRLYLVKYGSALHAGDERGESGLRRYGQGEWVACDIKSDRVLPHHRKWWAIFHDAYNNQEKFLSEKDFEVWLKIKAGHYDEHITADGQMVYIAKSIAFENMDQSEFQGFYDKTVDFMNELVPGVSGH